MRAPIQDKYRQLVVAGKMSRQRAYQLRHMEKGKCQDCSLVAVTKCHCLRHAVLARERERKKRGFAMKYDSKTRRMERVYKPPSLERLPRR